MAGKHDLTSPHATRDPQSGEDGKSVVVRGPILGFVL